MYRKTYRCVVEGQQESMYLNHLAKLVKDFPKRVITFNISEGNAKELEKSYVEYDSACLFDFDFNKTEFENNLLICQKLNNKNKPGKRKSGHFVYHAYSNICFDLWLILHKESYTKIGYKNDCYVNDVIRIYNLDKGSDIKSKDSIEKILNQISLTDVQQAIIRAEAIKSDKQPADAHFINEDCYFDNPDLSIQVFTRYILEKAGIKF